MEQRISQSSIVRYRNYEDQSLRLILGVAAEKIYFVGNMMIDPIALPPRESGFFADPRNTWQIGL